MECILSGRGVLSDLKMKGILVVSLRLRNCRFWSHLAVADPDLQIRGGGRSFRPEIGGAVSKKFSSGLSLI